MTDLKDKRILVVEDDPHIRDVVRSFLTELGIDMITEAGTGFEALRFIDAQPAGTDLVICDWNMPGMSGFSVYRQLRTTHPNLPFIMLTARADLGSVNTAKEGGMQSYLIKPLSFQQLSEKVSRAFQA